MAPVGRPKKDRTLDAEQRQVLEELYYTVFRSGIGMRALWEHLKKHPRQKAETLANGKDSKGRPKKAWINWRDFKQWYNGQETAQLTRRAPTVSETRSGVPPPGEMFALAHLQADLIDMGELATGRKRYIMNVVDVVTGFSFLQTWDGNVNNRQTARVMEEIIDAVRKWLGAWPRRTELLTDNGTADFGAQFKTSVEAYEPLISVVHGVPNRPNSQGAVESSTHVYAMWLYSRDIEGFSPRSFTVGDAERGQINSSLMTVRKNSQKARQRVATMTTLFTVGMNNSR